LLFDESRYGTHMIFSIHCTNKGKEVMQPKRMRMRGRCNATHNKVYNDTRETKIPKGLASGGGSGMK